MNYKYTEEDRKKFIKDLGGESYNEFIKELTLAAGLLLGFYAFLVMGFCL